MGDEMREKREIDMTSGRITGPLIRFILPMIGGSIFQQLYNTVDFLFVGNLMDKTAAAAVGASSTLITCAIGLFSGISVGTSVVAAQAIGAGKDEDADKALHSSAAFGIAGGVVMMLLAIVFAPSILRLLNTPENVIPLATVYLRIYMISVPLMIFYNMLSGGMRACGDSRTPFLILVVCGFLNVAFDWILIVLIPLGVAGVAIATMGSQTVSAIMAAVLMSRKDSRIRFSLSKLHMDGRILKKVLKIGLPAGVQTIIITFSNVMVQYYINAFGETAVAAFATYYKVENFNYLPIMAFGMASTTFAGQNTGAGQFKRIRSGTVITTVMGSAVVFVIASIILLFPRTVFGWFMKDPEVVENALTIAMVSFPFYWIYPILEVMGGAIRGMGYSILSMVVIIVNLCVIRVSLLAVFSRQFHSIKALASAYPITWATASTCFLIAFFVIIQKKIRQYNT